MENKLRLAIKLFEDKINETEEKYMEKCNGNFDREKMRRYVNRKLKKLNRNRPKSLGNDL